MTRYFKYILLPLIAILITAALLAAGCDRPQTAATSTPAVTAGTAMTGAELNQLIADAALALPAAGTYKFRMDLDMDMAITGGPQAGPALQTLQAGGEIDGENDKMRLTVDISLDSPGAPEASRDIATEIYVLGDFIYLKMDVPYLGEQWIKAPRTQEMMEAFDVKIMEKQLATLNSPVEIKLTGYETIDGTECYVVGLVPNYRQLVEFVMGLQTTDLEIDWENLGEAADVFRDVSFTAWIARDTRALKKMAGSLLVEMTPEQAGTDADFEKLSMDINMGIELYDYGAPVDIVLPEEAASAIDVSG
jgi:hypothetical protein